MGGHPEPFTSFACYVDVIKTIAEINRSGQSEQGDMMAQPAQIPDYEVIQMISAKSIAARLEELAREIEAVFAGTEKLVVVGLLRGSFVFIADLVRELDLPVEVDFLEASSYGNTMESSREVRILKDLRGEVAGRDVLVVEDIVDTGHTLAHVVNLLRSREPARLRTIALLDKPTRREVDIRADWIGFEIPDEFVVGYGIDFAQRNRNLPYIGKVRMRDQKAG
jgi:hypoxanthine phosphoribosyltransferase